MRVPGRIAIHYLDPGPPGKDNSKRRPASEAARKRGGPNEGVGSLWPHTWSHPPSRRIVDGMDGVTGDAAPAVAAALNDLAPESRRNRLYVALGGHMSTTRYAPATVTITNARPYGDDLGLDRSGFTLLEHRSVVADFGCPADGVRARGQAVPARHRPGRGAGEPQGVRRTPHDRVLLLRDKDTDMEQLPPETIAALTALGPDITPELVEESWALLTPFHEKAGYAAPRIDRDLRYGDDPRHRLRDSIAEYGGDPSRIVVAGHSAGCVHVASYLTGQGGGSLDGVLGAGLLSGFYQFDDVERGDVERAYFGDARAETVSTLNGLLDVEVPLIFAVAERDPRLNHLQVAALNAAWFARKGTVPHVVWSAGHNHISQIGSIGVDDLALGAQLARFVANCVVRAGSRSTGWSGTTRSPT
jgi:hypothetical protein